MDSDGPLDLGVDPGTIRSFEDYQAVWRRLSGVRARMIEKNEQCRHSIGDSFDYANHYDKPAGICTALHHVFQLYLWRVSVGFPSWEDDSTVYKIHCPDKKGTVWELIRIVPSEDGNHQQGPDLPKD
ncbi:MAG: hypothetical protein AMJ54_11410 [Deltaproteobacteria bacterium SG8_13]|nr:MAG: hypothetical protein AMJ54_11410 [Deltaproteobacteria bacterium SG8_13]